MLDVSAGIIGPRSVVEITMGGDHDSQRSKVARLIREYGLSGLGDELERRWTRTEQRDSLRDLAEYFNRQLLRKSLEDENAGSLDATDTDLYHSLTSDDVTSGVRQETRSQLERQGVDTDSLEDDFVSYQSMRTYLRNVRDATPPENSVSPEAHRNRKYGTIQRLRSRLNAVTEKLLAELRGADHLVLGEFEVIVAVRVRCSDCGTTVPVTDLLTDGGCECSS